MQPQKRKLTERQMEALRRRRREERMRALVLIAVTLALCVGAALFVMRPDEPDHVKMAIASRPTATPAPTAVPTAAPTMAPTAQPATATQTTADPTGVPSSAPTSAPTAVPTAVPTATPEPELRSVRLRIGGSVTVSDAQLSRAFADGQNVSYNFAPQFELIQGALSNADYTLLTLETTLGLYDGMDYSGTSRFNSPDTLLAPLAEAGVDMLNLGTDHILDRWFDGLKNTVSFADAYGFQSVGAYPTREESAEANIVDINGITFGFVSYVETTHGLEDESDAGAKLYGVSYLSSADVEGDIQRLRDAGADIVVALAHWGGDYDRNPTQSQMQQAERLARAGADIILGSNPQVLQPMGVVNLEENGATRPIFVAYSLGNLLTTNETDTAAAGMILELTVTERADGVCAVTGAGYVPTWCWKHDGTVQTVAASQYRSAPPEGMSAEDWRAMSDSMARTAEMMGAQFAILNP